MKFKNRIFTPYTLLYLFSLMFTIGIAVDYDARWTIRNNTEHYIHVLVNNEPSLYIRPHDTFKIETDSRNIKIEAFYSPGQEISGSVTRKYTAASSDERGCEGCPIAPDSRYSVTFNPEDFQ